MLINDCNPLIRYACVSEFSPRQSASRMKYLLDCRAMFLLDGGCMLTIDGQADKIPLSKNDLILLPAGTGFTFSGPQPTMLLGIVCFDYTKRYNALDRLILAVNKKQFENARVLTTEPFEDYPVLNAPLVLTSAAPLRRRFMSVLDSGERFDLLGREECSADLKKLICMALYMYTNQLNYSDKRINEILRYINAHYSEDISNEDICEQVGYHPYYLNNLVRSYTGHTIHWHLVNRRLDAAKRLLNTTDKSITSIAEECGFFSQTKFSNCFKRTVGITPSEYRHGRLLQPESLI